MGKIRSFLSRLKGDITPHPRDYFRDPTPRREQIEIKEINKLWSEYLRNHPYLRGWKKEYTRSYWNRSGDVHLGLSLIIGRVHYMTLAVQFSVPQSIKPIIPEYDVDDHNGFYFGHRVCRAKGVEIPIVWDDWPVGTPDQFNLDLQEIDEMIEKFVIPCFERVATENDFRELYAELKPGLYKQLPVVLFYEGLMKAQHFLAQGLRDMDGRPEEKLCKWLADQKVVPLELTERIRLAGMQMEDDYVRRINILAVEIENLSSKEN
jgi:hypothetical protein